MNNPLAKTAEREGWNITSVDLGVAPKTAAEIEKEIAAYQMHIDSFNKSMASNRRKLNSLWYIFSWWRLYKGQRFCKYQKEYFEWHIQELRILLDAIQTQERRLYNTMKTPSPKPES